MASRRTKIQRYGYRMEHEFEHVDEAIAMSTMYAANHLGGVAAIVCLTESGATPLWMSRLSSGLPIYAFSRQAHTRRRVALFRGVTAIPFEAESHVGDQLHVAAIEELKQRHLVTAGDYVLLTQGSLTGKLGGTDSLKISTVT